VIYLFYTKGQVFIADEGILIAILGEALGVATKPQVQT
jgi:hypothetical protein